MKRFVISILFVFLMSGAFPTEGVAQVGTHLYLVPVIGSGLTLSDLRRPKYLTNYSVMDYGFQPVMLAASTVDDATDAAISANADVQRIPDNLDAPIGTGALAQIQNALESRNIPAGWVTTSLTYRQVIRTFAGFFIFLQRYAFVSNSSALVIGGTVTLNTQFNQLPLAVRTNLQNTALSLELSTQGITGTSTIREILKNIADQWGQRELHLGPITI